MNIETKYSIKDKVFFIHDNEVKTGTVKTISTESYTAFNEHYQPITSTSIKYDVSIECEYRSDITVKLPQNRLFHTKEELLASL